MNLKNLREKVKRKMSKEQKKKLISELRVEIIEICPWPKDSQEEIIEKSLKLKKILEKENQVAIKKGEPIPYPEDYGKEEEIVEDNLTKRELLEALGSQIMKELYPFWSRLAFLNAVVTWRKENKAAREKGLEEPHNVSEIENKEDRAERCFGICPYWTNKK